MSRTVPPLRMMIDFDGTLVEPNVAIILVGEFATNGPAVAHEIDLELHAGRITLREAWERQVALLPKDRLGEMAEWAVRHTPLRPGALELLELVRTHKVPTSIVSGGLDFYIRPILKNAGIDLPVFCDALEAVPNGHLKVTHPHGHATCRLCGICKAQVIRTMHSGHHLTVFAGDGSTDRYAAEVADIVFARRRLRTFCDRLAIPYYPFEEFGPVTEKMRGWLEGTEALPSARALGLSDSACPISKGLAAAQ
ncbi:MAG: MtnX-like HAD-IB family phosphatase [Thermoplasmata archaeon]|nr:MtnX-like HAD-IB family phosphatase [Thermoplasmata archaeon]